MAVSAIHTGFGFRQNGGRENNDDISIYYEGTEVIRTTAALTTMRQNVAMSGTLAMGTNNITGGGSVLATNAAGYGLLNEAATATNPTVLPNRADPNTGVGWVSADILALVANGAEVARVAASVVTLASGVDLQFSTTGFPIMAITDSDSAVEAALWYSAADNKLEFFNGSTKEAITSSGFLWQAYENPTIYRQMYSPSFNEGINPDVFVKDGTWASKPLIPGLSVDQFEWHVGDKSIMVVESFLSDGEVHALPYPLEEALRETKGFQEMDQRVLALERFEEHTQNGWLQEKVREAMGDAAFKTWLKAELVS